MRNVDLRARHLEVAECEMRSSSAKSTTTIIIKREIGFILMILFSEQCI